VLASLEKLNAASAYKVVGFDEISGIITEPGVPGALTKPYEALGIPVTRA
jgi:hypothetical protein